MIKAVTVTNNLNESLRLELRNPDPAGLAVKKIEGLGPVKADINVTEIATADGAIYNSARVGSRNIVLTLALLWAPTIEAARLKTYRYFPEKMPVTLDFETDARYARITGFIEHNNPDIFSRESGTVVSVICPRPYFVAYDPRNGDGRQRTSFSSIIPKFEFPFSNESLTTGLIELSVLDKTNVTNIAYSGDAEAGALITIHATGPASMITLYNRTTQQSLVLDTSKIAAITGAAFGDGDDIVLSTVPGQKYIRLVRAGQTYNILNVLGRDSYWFSLLPGDNAFSYSAQSGSENIIITFENEVLYRGI